MSAGRGGATAVKQHYRLAIDGDIDAVLSRIVESFEHSEQLLYLRVDNAYAS